MDDLVIVAAVAVFVLVVHALFAVYLYRSRSDSVAGGDVETSGDRGVVTDGATSGSVDTETVDGSTLESRPEPIVSESTHLVSCPSCGAGNDPTFRFCRRCIADLSNGR